MPDRDTMRAILEEPFPPEQIKRRAGGSGQQFDYIPGEAVIRKLNDATDGCWDLRIKNITEKAIEVRGRDGNLIRTDTQVLAQVALTIDGLGTREHIGVQTVSERGGEDLIKGAITDALKKAATLFGVALHLYDDEPTPRGQAPRPAPQQQRPQPARQSAPPPAQGPADQAPPERRPAAREPAPAAPSGEPAPAAEMTWNEFWPWAKASGLLDKNAVEEALGEPVGNRSPAQLHALLSGWSAESGAAGGITEKQTKRLWTVADQKFGHQTREVLHALAQVDYGVPSLDLLTVAQASTLIDHVQDTDASAIFIATGVIPSAPPAEGAA